MLSINSILHRDNNKVLFRIGCRMVLDEQGARHVHKHTSPCTDHETFTDIDLLRHIQLGACSLLFFSKIMISARELRSTKKDPCSHEKKERNLCSRNSASSLASRKTMLNLHGMLWGVNNLHVAYNTLFADKLD